MRLLLFALGIALAGAAFAQAPNLNTQEQARYQRLIEELRCLVCQNQNIAESNAPLAEDLREQVAEMIIAGRSDEEIKDYLVARYGDFVLYRPPFKPYTWLLWGGPFLLLLLGLLVALRVFRNRRTAEEDEAPDKDAIDALLHERSGDGDKS